MVPEPTVPNSSDAYLGLVSHARCLSFGWGRICNRRVATVSLRTAALGLLLTRVLTTVLDDLGPCWTAGLHEQGGSDAVDDPGQVEYSS